MKKVGMLFLSLFCWGTYASEFKYIKLDPKFEEYLLRVNNGPQGLMPMAKMKEDGQSSLENRMRKALLGSSTKGFTAKSMGLAGDEASDEPPLYEEIRTHLESSHQQIGLDEVTRIDRINREFNLGTENFSGFSWQKPFGTVQVFVDRQVTPNLLSESAEDKFLIQDTFTFQIEATTYLESLKQAKLAQMTSADIGAFAGITFRRIYTYYHYARTYQEGLTSDFTKLFLPFTRFNQHGLESMDHKEIIKREDKFTAAGGGLISTPPIYNISFSAGILAEADLEQGTSIQSLHTEDANAQRFTMGVRRKASKKVGAALQLQLDFFNLLKLTLVRAEMKYEYTEGKEFTLGFSSSQWQHALSDEVEGDELRSIMKGFTEIKTLEPYIIRLDQNQSETVESYGSVLLWGRLEKSKHETNRIIKDGEVHLFHKSFMQITKTTERLISRLINELLYLILKLPVGTKDVAIYDKQVTMEYKETHPQAANTNIQRVKTSEDFSFRLSRSFETAKLKNYKGDVTWFLSEFTTLPKNYQSDIKNNRLIGPLRVDSHLRVEKAGFDYFIKLPVKDIFGNLVRVCKSKKLKEWQNDVERTRMLNATQKGADACVKTIGKAYLAFLDDYEAYYKMPSLAKLRVFLLEFVHACENITDIASLFGPDNTFLNGELNAHLPNGSNFRDVFSRGQFRGYGVIDNFKRANGMRTPASIISE